MSEQRISRDFWALTSILGLAIVFSFLVALGGRTSMMTIGGLVTSSLAMTVWLRLAWVRGLCRTPEETRPVVPATPAPKGCSDSPDETSAKARPATDQAVQTYYQMVVKLSHVRDECRHARADISGALDNARRSCLNLRQALVPAVGAPGRDSQALAAQEGEVHRVSAGGWAGAGYPNSMQGILEEVMRTVREMAQVLREVDHNAKELTTSTEETVYSMSRLDAFLQDMANSGRELEASTETANQVALEGTKVVAQMGKENEAIITTVKDAALAVEDLGRWSQEVGKIVEVIRDIADETNLLALNAAIIAAQSGEHGKAFGVVAEEIRGLAERTSSSTKEISDLVKAVQENVANVVQSMKRSLQRVEKGELLARNAGTVLERVFESFESSRSLAKQIATSTFEHKIDSSHVVRSLHKLTDIAKRLEAHNSGKWTTASETLATARILRALSPDAQAAIAVIDPESAGAAPSVPDRVAAMANGEGRPFIPGYKADLDNCCTALDQVQGRVSDVVKMVEDVTASARFAARRLDAGPASERLHRCWEITGCRQDIRERCPAYQHHDWRCFLIDDVACTDTGPNDLHGRRKCYECQAFATSAPRQMSSAMSQRK